MDSSIDGQSKKVQTLTEPETPPPVESTSSAMAKTLPNTPTTPPPKTQTPTPPPRVTPPPKTQTPTPPPRVTPPPIPTNTPTTPIPTINLVDNEDNKCIGFNMYLLILFSKKNRCNPCD